jgi:hypothetical protein
VFDLLQPAPRGRSRCTTRNKALPPTIGVARLPASILATRFLPGLAALLLCSTLIGACATEPAIERTSGTAMRLIVKLVQPSEDRAAIERLVSQSAGVPARYLAATSAAWHAVALDCDGTSACEAALTRLRADRRHFEAIERDERKRIVTP